MGVSEVLIVVVLIAAVVFAVRYYFTVYRKSPGVALGSYLGAINHGNVKDQYAFIDEEDRSDNFPTVDDYEKGDSRARGFVDRVVGISLGAPEIDPKDPRIAKIEATLSIRKVGQELYQADSDKFTDQYVMRKDKDGEWKVLLSQSKVNSFSQATPSKIGN
jgi:hypothetical protein